MTDKEKFIEKMLGFEDLYAYYLNSNFCYYRLGFWDRCVHMFSPEIRFKRQSLDRYCQMNAAYFRTSSLFIRNPASVYRLMAKMARHVMGMKIQ